MDKSDREYTNGEITVFWKPGKCIHATTCYRELIEVFNPRKRPWVNMHGAPTDRIIEVVDKCPTQALSWKYNDPVKEQEWQATQPSPATSPDEKPVLIQIMRDGPIVAQGKFKVFDPDGKERKAYSFTSFCRCGNSNNMPFCDGNHRLKGFQSDK